MTSQSKDLEFISSAKKFGSPEAWKTWNPEGLFRKCYGIAVSWGSEKPEAP